MKIFTWIYKDFEKQYSATLCIVINVTQQWFANETLVDQSISFADMLLCKNVYIPYAVYIEILSKKLCRL